MPSKFQRYCSISWSLAVSELRAAEKLTSPGLSVRTKEKSAVGAGSVMVIWM